MSDYLKQVLRDKLPDSTEIELHLFEFCNLSCAFCGQDHASTVGMNEDSIMQKAVLVREFIEKSDKDSHIINIMGGEIFNDEVPDYMFDAYSKFHEYVSTAPGKIRFNWVTNLIFEKRHRVREFIDSHAGSFISTSYDFAGRGLNVNRSLTFDANLTRFSDKINVIGFVLTRPSIKKILNKKDTYFDHLYQNYTLYFDYYVPELSSDKMMPSEQEMLDCMLYITEHYPNVYPIKDLLENKSNKMTCYSLDKLTLLPDNREVKCRYMEYKAEDFLTPIDYSTNEHIIQAHLDRSGCLGCEWFDRCQFRCFVQADWAKLDRLDDCMFRTFFEITNGSNN